MRSIRFSGFPPGQVMMTLSRGSKSLSVEKVWPPKPTDPETGLPEIPPPPDLGADFQFTQTKVGYRAPYMSDRTPVKWLYSDRWTRFGVSGDKVQLSAFECVHKSDGAKISFKREIGACVYDPSYNDVYNKDAYTPVPGDHTAVTVPAGTILAAPELVYPKPTGTALTTDPWPQIFPGPMMVVQAARDPGPPPADIVKVVSRPSVLGNECGLILDWSKAPARTQAFPVAIGVRKVGGTEWFDIPSTDTGQDFPFVGLPVNTKSIKLQACTLDDEGRRSTPVTLTQTATTSTGDPSIDIVVSRDTGVAPFGVIAYLDGRGWSEEKPWRDLYIKWSFNDPGEYTNLANDLPWDRVYEVAGKKLYKRGHKVFNAAGTLVQTLTNLTDVPAGKNVKFLGYDRDIAYGHISAHTWHPKAADFAANGGQPVVYELKVEVTSHGRLRNGLPPLVAKKSITVTDPDAFFAGEKTILVSSTGNWSGAPDPVNNQKVSSLDAALSILATKRDTDRRVLIRRGEKHETGRIPDNYLIGKHLQYGNYGDPTAPLPLIGPNEGLSVNSGNRHTGPYSVWGLDLKGGYDPTGDDPEALYVPSNERAPLPTGISVGANVDGTVIHGCRIGRWGVCASPGGTNGFVVTNCHIYDWYNFGVFAGEAGWIGFAGTAIKQNPATRNGPGGKSVFMYADHGPIRVSRLLGPFSMSMGDLASFNGWNTEDDDAGGETSYSVQPALRVNNGGERGQRIMFDRLRVIAPGIKMPVTNTYTPKAFQRAVFDKVYVVCYNSGIPLASDFGGVTFRNVIGVVPNIDGWGRSDMMVAFDTTGNPEWTDVLSGLIEPVEVYNCTLVSLKTTDLRKNWSLIDSGNSPEYYVANNIASAPLHKLDPDQPLSSEVLFIPNTVGKRFADEPIDANFKVPVDTARTFQPLPGSPAIGSATGKIALDDFYGNLRGTTPSRGAIEPKA